jgi:hypothetical protein
VPQETRRRSARRPAASACAVAIAAGLFLLSPRPPDTPYWKAFYVVLSEHLGYVYSIDSPRFVNLAREPWHLLDRRERRQSRPLYIFTASMLRACLAPLFPEHATGILLLDPAYAAFVVANFVVLCIAMLAFQGLFPDPAWPFGVFATSLLLIANDVVKLFFWTPHTQVFNVLAPVVAMLCCRWLVSHPAIRPRTLLILGLGLGALALYYGSFLLLLPATVAAVALGRARATEPLPRFLTQLCALSIGFVIAPLVWTAIVVAVAGEFYSDEIARFRQFVWILDAWRAGVLGQEGHFAALLFVRSSAVALWFSAALAVVLACIARSAAVRPAEVIREHGPTLAAAAITFAAALPFFALLGTYGPRLSWNFVPPVLAVVAATGSTVRSRLRPLAGRVLDVGLALAVVTWLAYEVAKRGPWY